MFCSNCGAEVADNAVFCRNCGGSLVPGGATLSHSHQPGLKAKGDTKKKFIQIGVAVMSLVIIIALVLAFTKSGNSDPAGLIVGAWGCIEGEYRSAELRFYENGVVELHDLEDEPDSLEAVGLYSVLKNKLSMVFGELEIKNITIKNDRFTTPYLPYVSSVLVFRKK